MGNIATPSVSDELVFRTQQLSAGSHFSLHTADSPSFDLSSTDVY